MTTACSKIAIVMALAAAILPLAAWNGHEQRVGDFTLLIHEIPDVPAPAEPTSAVVTLTNAGATAVSGELRVHKLVDDWRAVGPAVQRVTVPAGESTSVTFQIASGPFVFSALYPLHIQATLQQGDEAIVIDAVRIFTVNAKRGIADATLTAPPELPALLLPANGMLRLLGQTNVRVAWNYYDQPLQYKPIGWLGSDSTSRAHVSYSRTTRGDTRSCLNMHPTWYPGGGTVLCDYRVQLPAVTPIRFTFANALRDSSATEPLSDGVDFRVWVLDGDAEPATLFSQFTDSKTWLPGEVDLSAYAGKDVILRLESHPGPNRDTQVDSCFWAEPTLSAGTPPVFAPASEPPAALKLAAARLLGGSAQAIPGATALPLAGDSGVRAAVVAAGDYGLLDGWFLFVGPEGISACRGLELELNGESLTNSNWRFLRCETFEAEGRPQWLHRFVDGNGQEATVRVGCWADGAGMRVKIEASQRLTLAQPGPWHDQATSVFYGHGYAIRNPKPFRASYGGHNLASSHVGMEFAKSPALLVAVDNPPNHFEVNPARRVYALATHENCVMTFVPEATAMAAAVAYRSLFDKKPAGAVSKLAGRMLFDIWGGEYRSIADHMREMLRYGVSDAILTVHNWQRWGYDYRLPDIWPPSPRWGTLDDLKDVGRVCDPAGIPWGLHDNYIDFYPDADDFSYRKIYFSKNGEPVKAWYNRGRDALSYKWRPDQIMPYVQRNLRLVKEGLGTSHCFIDVFTSATCTDWYDHDGVYHSSLETRRHWGEAFAWIRDYLGDAPTTSEAGHDQLIGYLDGADCQWMTISSDPGRFMIKLDCDEWNRVPWYSAVNHSNFVLMGAGYSTRYEGQRSRLLHGIVSDDYLSAELLAGHSLMVDAGCWGYNALRKYYLAQDFIRHVALRHISRHEFVGGNIHRQYVEWDNGARVWVNRGENDWLLADGRCLPPFGFAINYGANQLTLEKLADGTFREHSRGPSGWFFNARQSAISQRQLVPAVPSIEDFLDLGEGRFSWTLRWDAKGPGPSGLRTFVHYMEDKNEPLSIRFQADHGSSVPPEQWQGVIRDNIVSTIPETCTDARFPIFVGLYKSDLGRVATEGRQTGGTSAWIGTLVVTRNDDGVVTALKLEPAPAPQNPSKTTLQRNPIGTMVDFELATTDGAFRLRETSMNVWELTPLPGQPAFTARLHLNKLFARWDGVSVSAEAREAGAEAPAVKYELQDRDMVLAIDPEAVFKIVIKR
ncbi:hypothetical protein [Oligosphaera ethanolica]|uniref:Uncharacterized protein n=1 Tax=Oligosphaera ethanolica TaxID=760260 RepID=A0AAE3VD54_9BACT|nr:hypothetical protein [Oligosphaera ethanolica]MDQ0288128.1 hypothetical protein [Oligosphaera ethanolica]